MGIEQVKNKKWWMPLKEAYGLDYQCDTVSDCIGIMHQMWAEICRLRRELPRDGFERDDYFRGK